MVGETLCLPLPICFRVFSTTGVRLMLERMPRENLSEVFDGLVNPSTRTLGDEAK